MAPRKRRALFTLVFFTLLDRGAASMMVRIPRHKINGGTKTYIDGTEVACTAACDANPTCSAVNFNQKARSCFSLLQRDACGELVKSTDDIHYKKYPCDEIDYTFGSPAEETPTYGSEKMKTFVLQSPAQTRGLPTKGFLRGWSVYVKDNSTVFLQIWRPLDQTSVKLISSTLVESQHIQNEDGGFVCVDVEAPVQVSYGDMLGITFTESNPIPYKETTTGECNGAFYLSKDSPGSTSVGSVVKGWKIERPCRPYSIEANITAGTGDGIKLHGGDTPREGTAMLRVDGTWGSVCDGKSLDAASWPSVFCRNLGFDEAESAEYSLSLGKQAAAGPVVLMNPDCSSEFMDQCMSGTDTCAHDKDVYIKCKFAKKCPEPEIKLTLIEILRIELEKAKKEGLDAVLNASSNVLSMLEPVQSIERETYDFNNMSPEETAFYKEFMDEISKDWKAQQNQVSQGYRSDIDTMEGMVEGAVNETSTPGGGASTMEAEKLTMTMEETEAAQFLGRNINTTGANVTTPRSFGKTSGDSMLKAVITSYDSALGMWEPGEELSTSVVKLNVTRADDGRPLPPPEDPFTISFDNPDEIVWQNASANVTLLRNTTLMFYHAFDVSRRDADGGALLLEIGVDADSAPPEVYMKKDQLPTGEAEEKVEESSGAFVVPFTEGGTHYLGISFPYTNPGNSTFTREVADSILDTEPYKAVMSLSRCNVWNEVKEVWESNGCQVSKRSTVHNLQCDCKTSLASVSAKMFMAPNVIDFKTVWKKFAAISNNVAVLATVVVVLVIFAVVVICLRRQDKQDEEKWKVKELLDNRELDAYVYLVTVVTGLRTHAGTRSRVGFSLSGEKLSTGDRLLHDGVTKGFERGTIVTLLLRTPCSLGQIQYLDVWHDSSGSGGAASWFLDKIIVRDVLTDQTFVFLCNDWLAVEEGDGKIERVLPVAGTENVTEFKNRFSDLMRTNLTDGHLWYSMWARPSRSSFTRVQRAACCLSLLFLTMISNAMFFETEATTSRDADRWSLKVGPFRFSLHQLYTSFISLLIVLPVNIVIVTLFRKSRKPVHDTLNESAAGTTSNAFVNFWKTGKVQGDQDTVKDFNNPNFNDIIWLYKQDHAGHEKELDSGGEKVGDQKRCCGPGGSELPSYEAKLAWVLVFLSCSLSAFFLVLYSMDWGRAKSERWLTSFFLSFLQSLFLVDPIKVIVIAFAITLLTKKPRAENYMVTDDRFVITAPRINVQNKEETWPPRRLSAVEKKKCRSKRIQQKVCRAFFKEFLFFSVYMGAICVVCYAVQDPNSYPMARNIRDLCSRARVKGGLRFDQVTTTPQLFRWLDEVFLPAQFAQRGYRGWPLPWRRRRYMDDAVSYRIGPARLRQLRMTPEPCLEGVPAKSCRPSYSLRDENTQTFGIGRNDSKIKPFLTRSAWRFSPMLDIQGVPYWGQVSVYGGGGYIADMEINRPVSKRVIHELRDNRWIDKQTRVVFLEFTVYNPFVNLFCWTNIVFEYLPEGGILPTMVNKVFKLYFEDSFAGGVMVVAFFIFIAISVVIAGTFAVAVYKHRRLHFRSLTSCVEGALIVFAFAVIILYFSMYFMAKKTIAKFHANGRKYTQFHPVVATYDLLRYMFGFLVFVATVRLLLMLRIMKNVRIFGMTLRSTLKPFAFFFLQFSFIYMAFSHLAHIIFCRHLYGYMSLQKTFLSLIAFAIKQHNLSDMLESSPALGTIFYISYVLVVSLGVMNIFIATIVHYHHQVRVYMERDRNFLQRAVRDEVMVSLRSRVHKVKLKLKELQLSANLF